MGLVRICSLSADPPVLDFLNGCPMSPSRLATAIGDLMADENAQLEQACTHALDWGVPSSVECLPSPA